MSALTLLLLRFGFLLILWVFIFAVVYALRSDLFGPRVKRMPVDPNQVEPYSQQPYLDQSFAQPSYSSAAPVAAITPAPALLSPAFGFPPVSGQPPVVPPFVAPPFVAAPFAAQPIPVADDTEALSSIEAAEGVSFTEQFLRAPAAASPSSAYSLTQPVAVPAKSASATRLVITAGPRVGLEIELTNGPLSIGRSSESGLVIRDDYTSTHHARLMLWGDDWVIQDLDSTNGTFLGNVRVALPTPIPLNSPVRIGTTSFELRR